MTRGADDFGHIRERVRVLDWNRRFRSDFVSPDCWACRDTGWVPRSTPDPKRKFPWYAKDRNPPGPHYHKCPDCGNPKGKARP